MPGEGAARCGHVSRPLAHTSRRQRREAGRNMHGKRLTGDTEPPDKRGSSAMSARIDSRPYRRISLIKRCAARTTARDVRTVAPRAGSIMRCGSMGEFVAAGRRGTAGSGACPALVFSGTGRIACGAPAGSQIRALGGAPRQGTGQIRRSAGDGGRIPGGATGRHGPPAKMTLSLAVSCRWGRASGVEMAAGPGQRAGPAGGTGPGRSPGAAGSRAPRPVPAGPAPAGEPFMLAEPQRVQARGYRSQSLSLSSACLINGRGVTCSCWSRSAVLI